jgi:hypothetical protein
MKQYIPPKSSPADRCPACGGLQCLCRPRFFAGQLLTEEDLNRLDRYIREKNKLHNRYLHGTGVVCGLEVLCYRCKGQVLVKSGYAIDPCGEDIVVCKDEIVPVCDMIRQCKDKERQDTDCEDYYSTVDSTCKDKEETWVLAIRYDEKPSRGITALRGSTEGLNCSRCSGGSTDCGAGCYEGGNGKKQSSFNKTQKQTPAQCEPTVICEGYRYEVFRAPQRVVAPGHIQKRLTEGLNALSAPAKAISAADSQKSLKDAIGIVTDFLVASPTANCETFEAVRRIAELGNYATSKDQIQKARTELDSILTKYLYQWIGSALLSPCPDGVTNPRLVLATVTVAADDCRILRICNWTTLRQFVMTMPNIQRWLSLLSPFRQLRTQMESSNCPKPLEQVQLPANDYVQAKELSALVRDAFAGKSTPISAETIRSYLSGSTDKLKAQERNNMPQFLILNELLLPAFKAMAPDTVAKPVSEVESPSAKAAATREMKDLKAQVTKLKGDLAKQQKTIEKLAKRKTK